MKNKLFATFILLATVSSLFSAPKKNARFDIDLSPYANCGISDKNLTPLSNLSAKTLKFDKFDFKLVDPEKTGGKTLVKVDAKHPLTISLDGKNARGNNIKFLWACGNDITGTKFACVRFDIEFADGEKIHSYAVKERDIGSSNEPAHNTLRAMPAYVENPDSKTGVLYYYQFCFEGSLKTVKKITIESRSLYIAAISLSRKDIPSIETYKFDKKQWREVDLASLEIADGSALDVSEGVGEKPAGKFGRLTVSGDGHFAFEKRPDVRVRFKGTNWRPGDSFFKLIKDRDTIDKLAKIVRKQGYNLVRWRISMNNNEFESPWKLKPEVQDMYDYFLYAFAREGVYTHLMIASHNLGNPNFKWKDRTQLKFQMILGDPETREDWRRCAKMQLEHVNPYTKLAWKDDPSIATIEYYNEVELGEYCSDLRPDIRAWGEKLFRQYLEKRYGTFDEWTASQKRDGAFWKGDPKSFADVKILRHSCRHPDWMRFIIECGQDMNAFCRKVLREEIGAKMPSHQNNYALESGFGFLSDESGEYTAINTYHGAGVGWAMGAFNDQSSSLSNAAKYFRRTTFKHIAGKPMMHTEYQHCHWNKLKHECGLVFPAYAALQNYDNLTIHDAAIALKGTDWQFERSIVNNSPVYRANEFLSYCLFYRGDVKPATNRVELVVDSDFVKNSPNIVYAYNLEQSKIALLTGFATRYPSAKSPSPRAKITPADLQIKPQGATKTITSIQSTATGDNIGESFDVDSFVKVLREKKILAPENLTDPQNGVYQSQTGEITMFQKDEIIKVETPKTEGISLHAESKNQKLARLAVDSTSVDAAVAVASVDGKTLADSTRMVLVYNTDNIATDFKVSKNYNIIVAKGKYPVLMRVGKLSAKLKLPDNGKKYSLYSLKITGERAEKLESDISDDRVMNIEIDTSKTRTISPFFEIVAE